MNNILKFTTKNNIQQIIISKALNSNDINDIDTDLRYFDYNCKDKSTLFYGVYDKEDFKRIINHNGPIYILWGGNDIILSNTKRYEYIKKLLTKKKILSHIYTNPDALINLNKLFPNSNYINLFNYDLNNDVNVKIINKFIDIVLSSDINAYDGIPNLINSVYLNCKNRDKLRIFIICENACKLNQLILDKSWLPKFSLQEMLNLNSKSIIKLIEPCNKLVSKLLGNISFLGGCGTNYLKDITSAKNQGKPISIYNYIRFFFDKILPNYINKVIYLDCDMIVKGDIEDLYNLLTPDYTLGGVTSYIPRPLIVEQWIINPNDKYYKFNSKYLWNAGMYVTYLDKWRENNYGEKCINLMKYNNSNKIYVGGTQPVMNIIFDKNFLSIDQKWNLTGLGEGTCNRNWGKNYEIQVKNAKLLHWTGGGNPWTIPIDELNKFYAEEYYVYSKDVGSILDRMKKLTENKFILEKVKMYEDDIKKKISKLNVRKKIFIVNCCGGFGNHFGSFLNGLHFYMKYEFYKTHDFILRSAPTNTGYFTISDFFNFNNNIFDMEKFKLLTDNEKIDDKNKLEYNLYKEYERLNVWSSEENEELLKIEKLDSNLNNLNIETKTYLTKGYLNKNIFLNTQECFTEVVNENFCFEGIKFFNVTLKDDIKKKVSEFISNNNIHNTLGYHHRGTDMNTLTDLINSFSNIDSFYDHIASLIIKFYDDDNLDNIFICSDDEDFNTAMKIKLNKYNVYFNKNIYPTIKFPGLEKYNWVLSENDLKEIDKTISYKNISINNIGNYNVWRSKNQVKEGIIDLLILGNCSKICGNNNTTGAAVITRGYKFEKYLQKNYSCGSTFRKMAKILHDLFY